MEYHQPVLLEEVLSFVPESGLVVDGTVGDGGHAGAIIRRRSGVRVIGLDRDPESVRRATERVKERFEARTASYADLPTALAPSELEAVRFVLLDLGFSSAQMDNPERGLTFQHDGPLDMRYDQTDVTLRPAAEILNRENPHELTRIIKEYGEEPQAPRIARAIVAARAKTPFTRTSQLVDVIGAIIKRHPKDKIHPATLTFQALRIAVNHELDELDSFLQRVPVALPSGARVAVISFHSLEDRRVKQAFKALTKQSANEFGEPEPARAIPLTDKPVVASLEEEATNPRARSAKLRVIELV